MSRPRRSGSTMEAVLPSAEPGFTIDRMNPNHYRTLATLLEAETGIRLPASKQTMVESRLRKRVRVHGLASLDDYCQMLLDPDALDDELVHLIDCVTTNKTDFFREPDHFVILKDHVVPAILAQRQRKSDSRHLKIWSAACSIGAEPYTVAMVMDELSTTLDFNFSILGTDICTTVLTEARTAIYPSGMMEPVPATMRRRYVMQSNDPRHDVTRIVPELRARVSFQRLNLMDDHYPVDAEVDVIFCRNILIYFSRDNQDAIIGRLCGHLRPGGYLFLGHAETVSLPESFGMQPAFPTVFCRR